MSLRIGDVLAAPMRGHGTGYGLIRYRAKK
jgi:hypothetical protein